MATEYAKEHGRIKTSIDIFSCLFVGFVAMIFITIGLLPRFFFTVCRLNIFTTWHPPDNFIGNFNSPVSPEDSRGFQDNAGTAFMRTEEGYEARPPGT